MSDLITDRDIILLRDQMPLDELKVISKKTLKTYGFVDFHHTFLTMGYTKAFNNYYHKPKN